MEVIAAGAGGLLGFLGSLISSVLKYIHTKQQQTFEQAKWDHERVLLESNRPEQEVLIEPVHAPIQEKPSYQWVNAIKSLYRPVLTTGLTVISFLMFLHLSGDMLKSVVDSLIFCNTTAVVWWFGDRAFAPPGQKNR